MVSVQKEESRRLLGGGISGNLKYVFICVCMYTCACLWFRDRKEDIGGEAGKISQVET